MQQMCTAYISVNSIRKITSKNKIKSNERKTMATVCIINTSQNVQRKSTIYKMEVSEKKWTGMKLHVAFTDRKMHNGTSHKQWGNNIEKFSSNACKNGNKTIV